MTDRHEPTWQLRACAIIRVTSNRRRLATMANSAAWAPVSGLLMHELTAVLKDSWQRDVGAEEQHFEVFDDVIVVLVGVLASCVNGAVGACHDVQAAANRLLAIVFRRADEMNHSGVVERPM